MVQTQENGEKHFGPDLGRFGQNSGCHFFLFFFKNLASSGTRYHGQLSSFKISEKTYYPILRNLVTDGRTDRQTDESDFLGR